MIRKRLNIDGVLARLRSIEPSLKPAEGRIANYIIANPESIIHMPITELAEKCATAEATVVRVCKKIGCNGFQDLKIALSKSLVEPLKNIHEEISVNDDTKALATKVFGSAKRSLQDTFHILDFQQVEAAVKAMAAASKIDFYGSASSGIIAMDAHHKMLKTGLFSAAYNDPHMQVISASLLTDKDVAVGISHSGSNKDVIQSLRVAREAGAKTICITSYMKSPITKVSDIQLFVAANETNFRTEAMAARLSQLCLIDLLVVGISLLRQEETLQAIQQIRQGIALKRY
jgi:DNA-binding MurR/RpiR family transcriptional regulator